ncbi:MAG TPA: GTPase domain-containing protein, partial [Lentzea sp.]
FVCPCGRTHHDLVPGSQGVFRRTCLCGHRLPTLLVNGKRALPATCALCQAPLPALAQSLPTLHIPIVGGRGSGKSTFTRAASSRPLGDKHLLHLHDVPGEVYEHTEHLVDASFLGLARGMVLVVDPHADPKPVLDRVIDTLTELHGTAFPLAVVITKADLLPPEHHPYNGLTGPAAARQWLLDHHRVDLLNTADTHFTRVRCFVFPDDDPATPVLWLTR